MVFKRGNLTRFSLLIAGLFILALSIAYSASEPEGPDSISVLSTTGHVGSSGPVTIQAAAGNVSSLRIVNERSTEAWQGYYGNISGNITLEDSGDNLFYSWQLADPTGKVYAANHTTTNWASVYCLNTSHSFTAGMDHPIPFTRADGAVSSVNLTKVELDYGINQTDLDGLNETFNSYFAGNFRTGAITFDSSDRCSMANPYSQGASSAIWEEVILSDNDTIIFVSIIEENQLSYRASGEGADFQMLVLENGHVGSEAATTPYYFYVELA